MPRTSRFLSHSKVYHIIFKGIDDQTIFYDNQDRQFFLKQISLTKKDFNYVVYAYSLMVNHVHLVIKCQDCFLSTSMKSLLVRYVHYFNKKYKRKGPLMQNRFKSKNVENLRYFIELCRYVHRNPENAGLELTQNYQWSSYNEYVGKEKIINKNALLNYFDNNVENFVKYTLEKKDNDEINYYVEYEMIDKLLDEDLIKYIMKKFSISKVEEIPSYFKNKTKDELKNIIGEMANIQRINITQVARVTRLGRRFIEKVWNG